MSTEQFRPTGFRMLPPVVKNILIISGIFFLATYGIGAAFNIDLRDVLGLHFFAAEKFAPYQFLTYMFMHGEIWHIVFNMFAFWMFGYLLENIWGSKRFLIFFFVTGIGAALIQMLIFYFQTAPVLEAIDLYTADPSAVAFKSFIESDKFVMSEDIYNSFLSFKSNYNGLLAQSDSLHQLANSSAEQAQALSTQIQGLPEVADSLRLQVDHLQSQATAAQLQSDSISRVSLRSTIDFMDTYRRDFLNAPLVIGSSGAVFGILLAFGMMFPNMRIYIYFLFPIKAKWFVIIYGAIELFSGIRNNPGDNVAHFAHLGGMLFGLLLILWWRKRARRKMQ